jgi:iron(III)-enterobactin esterase
MKLRNPSQFSVATLFTVIAVSVALAQTAVPPQKTQRPAPPTRDPHTPGYVAAKELPDGKVPPANADGNFIIGPTHPAAPELSAQDGTLQGRVIEFAMNSSDSKIYPGIAREPNTFGTPDPSDPAKLVVTTSHPAPYARQVFVYVPKQYVPGSVAPFIVGADGPDRLLFSAIDKLIAEQIQNGLYVSMSPHWT